MLDTIVKFLFSVIRVSTPLIFGAVALGGFVLMRRSVKTENICA